MSTSSDSNSGIEPWSLDILSRAIPFSKKGLTSAKFTGLKDIGFPAPSVTHKFPEELCKLKPEGIISDKITSKAS